MIFMCLKNDVSLSQFLISQKKFEYFLYICHILAGGFCKKFSNIKYFFFKETIFRADGTDFA